MTFENYSKASKLRWSKKTPEERSEYARKIAKIKWSKMSKEDKTKHAIKMLSAKKK
jgi:hypothetical protein